MASSHPGGLYQRIHLKSSRSGCLAYLKYGMYREVRFLTAYAARACRGVPIKTTCPNIAFVLRYFDDGVYARLSSS